MSYSINQTDVQYELAIYHHNISGERHIAFQLFKTIADATNRDDAQYYVGFDVLERNCQEAYNYFTRSTDQDNNYIGVYYLGRPKDYSLL
jgi:TPR repeat protein